MIEDSKEDRRNFVKTVILSIFDHSHKFSQVFAQFAA